MGKYVIVVSRPSGDYKTEVEADGVGLDYEFIVFNKGDKVVATFNKGYVVSVRLESD